MTLDPARLSVRAATAADALVSARLSQEAFGAPDVLPDPLPDPCATHKPTYLAELDGRVVAKACDRPYESWYGGRRVPTSGIASVAVEPEARGQGVARALLREVLRRARDRGAVIAALYPTAPGIYRGLGFGYAGAYTWVRVPTADLAAVPAGRVRLERVDAAAWPELLACYTAWARRHDGALSRDDAGYPRPDALLAEHRLTAARDETGRLVGYAAWRRTQGLGPEAVLEVSDLIATTGPAGRALLASLGTHASAAPVTELNGAGEDLLPWHLPSKHLDTFDRRPYHVAVLDVAAALAARGWAPYPRVTASLEVTGLPVAGQDGCYRVRVADGTARVERLDAAANGAPGGGGRVPVLTAEGLGMLYAGCPADRIRLAGHLTEHPNGPADDATGATAWGLDALTQAAGGRVAAIRDYF